MTTEQDDSDSRPKRKKWNYLSPKDRDDVVWFFRWAEGEIADSPSIAGTLERYALPKRTTEAETAARILDGHGAAKTMDDGHPETQPDVDDFSPEDHRVRAVTRYRRIKAIFERLLPKPPAHGHAPRSSARQNFPRAHYFDVKTGNRYRCCFCSSFLESETLAVSYPDGMDLPPSGSQERRWVVPVMAHTHCHDAAFREDILTGMLDQMDQETAGHKVIRCLHGAYVRPGFGIGFVLDDDGNLKEVTDPASGRIFNCLKSGARVEVVHADDHRRSWGAVHGGRTDIPGLALAEGDGSVAERYRDDLAEACRAFERARYAVKQARVQKL